jgi:formate hydrogenlyase subunit 3/multisubunit Na+/H+ antiporter MnhD subunit
MSYNVTIVLLGWILIIAIFLGFIVLLRYLKHRERMALINHGINPNSLDKQHRNQGLLRAGLITMMVGFSLTIGLYPISFLLPPTFPAAPFHLGPWLLPGLIPLGVGIGLIGSYYLEQSPPPPPEEHEGKVISIEEHLEREHWGG